MKPHQNAIKDIVSFTAVTAASFLLSSPYASLALPPPDNTDADRCAISAFDKFASTRAKFSMEASNGGMVEALVDVRDCNFKGANLDGKVLSGVLMSGADCEGCSIKRAEVSRADLRSADFRGVAFEDSNLYGTMFAGADLRGATFENAILSNASFGRDGKLGPWAQLGGAHFEGALLSSSDIERLCENPTLDSDVRKYELGCRSSK
ncbi:hypothetical protein CEUSTIGMA_g759.t1 [Chlamydomonas eustigma]|uniref:Pentapeptide repeat-containing protein n=1 Tax=Chlamydomonas eustigma TaxID=1157962 RepID=A0A250WR36_9CHLO|nr:hypothetical protein CEUSTIGMA_g759.t1 [Chlamydomonas eustigma]|eukprot:GAX73305.1 hypothetical protein CEUSTIGMA_g759.t1 [Chlamydomonas eustigma]